MMIALLAFVATVSQVNLTNEVTVRGMRIFARCWRTPTGDDPYMIWTIGTRDEPAKGQTWIVRGDSISFPGLSIVPESFRQQLQASSPDEVVGRTFQQPGGENAETALILGHIERVESLTEVIALGKVELVPAKHPPASSFGQMFHWVIPRPISQTTQSGLTIDIPKQDADTRIAYPALAADPMAALLTRPAFKASEERLPKSPLWQKFGGPIDIAVTLQGVGKPFGGYNSAHELVAEAHGFDIKEGAVDVGLDVTQTAVLESYPVQFRVKVMSSKQR